MLPRAITIRQASHEPANFAAAARAKPPVRTPSNRRVGGGGLPRSLRVHSCLPDRDGARQHFRCIQCRSFAPRDGVRDRRLPVLPLRSSGMNRCLNSVSRQATLGRAVVTLIGDVFAHLSHFGPQWAEPVVTAAVLAGNCSLPHGTSGSGCAPPKIEFCRREHNTTPAADPCCLWAVAGRSALCSRRQNSIFGGAHPLPDVPCGNGYPGRNRGRDDRLRPLGSEV